MGPWSNHRCSIVHVITIMVGKGQELSTNGIDV
jgi:hypothetical protein